MPVWCVSRCVFSWEGVFCARVVCFQLGGGRLCQCGVFPAGRGRLCQCGVFPAGRWLSVPVWCVSSWEGVVCARVVCFQL